MPNVRVDMHSALRPRMKEISAAIHEGLVTGLGMTPEDLFQIFRLHEPGELVYTTTFPNADRTDIIFIEVLASRGYTDQEKALGLAAIVNEVEKLGIKRDNLLLMVTETGPSDWYAPEKAA